jgi:hypothetical protein
MKTRFLLLLIPIIVASCVGGKDVNNVVFDQNKGIISEYNQGKYVAFINKVEKQSLQNEYEEEYLISMLQLHLYDKILTYIKTHELLGKYPYIEARANFTRGHYSKVVELLDHQEHSLDEQILRAVSYARIGNSKRAYYLFKEVIDNVADNDEFNRISLYLALAGDVAAGIDLQSKLCRSGKCNRNYLSWLKQLKEGKGAWDDLHEELGLPKRLAKPTPIELNLNYVIVRLHMKNVARRAVSHTSRDAYND